VSSYAAPVAIDPGHGLTQAPAFAPIADNASHISFDLPLREARDAFERAYFEYHLVRENGSMTRVAERTGLERTHLYRKLKQLGVEPGKLSKKATDRAASSTLQRPGIFTADPEPESVPLTRVHAALPAHGDISLPPHKFLRHLP